ncbi:hypothetical protein [Streptococcus macacae]|uniref:Uncharacterized protein n=1 Tax=Streptococcus macacae NCTC 11558 TaxID=764298 RepID=G5JUX7_9STRE|nr:hypothetical protein [Streptococcus macacae]EHJ51625.1 hypothetical protein STRMA_1362 [Streptococcus macacae NCTC 11558]SUN79275.1 Uncharacterised protein [Streptococcus macacae NCTC 11558]
MKRDEPFTTVNHLRERKKELIVVTCVFIAITLMKGYISLKKGMHFIDPSLIFIFIIFLCVLAEWISGKVRKNKQSVKTTRLYEKKETLVIYTLGFIAMAAINLYTSITTQAHFIDVYLVLMFLIAIGTLVDLEIENIRNKHF